MPPDGARCATHPDAHAGSTCPRCGDHACPACWEPDDALCLMCAAAHGGLRPRWESQRRFVFHTLGDILRRPQVFFARTPRQGRSLRALELAAAAWVTPALAFVVVAFLASDPPIASFVLAVLVVMAVAIGSAFGVAVALVQGLMLWAVARFLGGRGLDACVRAAAYGQCGVIALAASVIAKAFLPHRIGSVVLLLAFAAFVQHRGSAFGHFLRARRTPGIAPRLVGALLALGWVGIEYLLVSEWRRRW